MAASGAALVRRLVRLEARAAADARRDPAGGFEARAARSLSVPTPVRVLAAWFLDRAYARFCFGLERGGTPRMTAFAEWHRLDDEDQDALAQAEADDLAALVALHGEADGWDRWHARAPHVPAFESPVDGDAFARRLAQQAEIDEANRAASQRFRAAWPEWRPGATAEERERFDALLVAEADARMPPADARGDW